MRRVLGQVPDHTLVRPAPDAAAPATAGQTVKEIPYDYVARFQLEGRRGNRVQDVINISVDGAFVAVAIGYSFIPARPNPNQPQIPVVVANLASPLSPADQERLFQCLLARLCGIDFKYSVIDSGAGRELQNQPIHNIAGLGESAGNRPFRPLAKPMLFLPRSTIRIEIEEVSEGSIYGYDDPGSGRRIGAELYIVLHGYKILGYGTGLS